MQKVGLAESQLLNGELIKSTLVVIFWFKRTSAIMVHGIWKKKIPRTSRTIAKVTNILKELANTINKK